MPDVQKQIPVEIRTHVEGADFSQIQVAEGDSDRVRNIQTQSSLFRNHNFLPVALEETIARNEEKGTLSVLSMGCSMGAEVDSVLALSNSRDRSIQIDITGIDANPDMIEVAREGTYEVMSRTASVDAVQVALKGFGFSMVGDWAADKAFTDLLTRSVDSTEVREGHQVHFKVGDARKPLVTDSRFDLILLNNVLCHWPTDVATQIARNAAEALGSHGVLSIGENDMGSMENEKGRFVRYRKFVRKLAKDLKAEYDLEPVVTSPRGTPAIFAKLH